MFYQIHFSEIMFCWKCVELEMAFFTSLESMKHGCRMNFTVERIWSKSWMFLIDDFSNILDIFGIEECLKYFSWKYLDRKRYLPEIIHSERCSKTTKLFIIFCSSSQFATIEPLTHHVVTLVFIVDHNDVCLTNCTFENMSLT